MKDYANVPRRIKIHCLLTLAVMIFIFLQSALPGEVSGAESGLVMRLFTWFAGVTGISGLGELDPEVVHMVIRKTAHFIEYMMLGCCLMVNTHDWYEAKGKELGIRRGRGKTQTIVQSQGAWWLVVASWKVGAIYASADEFHQRFVPDRVGSPHDVLIDSAGVAVGALLVHMIWLIRKKDKKHEERTGAE